MQQVSPQINELSVVILFGFIQALLIIYIFSHRGRYKLHRPFVWFVIILIINQIESFLSRSGYMVHTLFMVNVTTPLIFLFGPLIYEYVLLRTGRLFTLKERMLHAIPFIFYFLYSFSFFLQPRELKYNAFKSNFHPGWPDIPVEQTFQIDPWNIQGWVVVEIFSLHVLVYSGLCLFRIAKSNQFSLNKSIRNNSWLLFVSAVLMAGGLMLFFSQGGIINGKVFFRSPFPEYSPDLFASFSMYLLMAYLLSKPEFFKFNTSKYQKSSLSDSFIKKKLNHLLTMMDTERPYLNPEFSLNTLSMQSGISKHHISQILNEELDCSFFELTNRYRIEEAKRRLKSDSGLIKMEQLSFDLGYGSKSTFYAAFKKSTGLTPSKFRNSAPG